MAAESVELKPRWMTNHINWGAVFAGVFVAMFCQLLLSLLGLAVGLTAYTPGQDPTTVGIGTTIWMLIAVLISVFVGAFTAGKLSESIAHYDGMIHGVVTLSFLAIVSLYLATVGLGSIVNSSISYGLQAARTPQIQQVLPSGGSTANQVTPAERQRIARASDANATRATWGAFLTTLLSLGAAMTGGHLGKKSRFNRTLQQSYS